MSHLSNFKSKQEKYGLLPAKDPEVVPWHQLCVDLIGPYKIPIKSLQDPKMSKRNIQPYGVLQ